MNALSHLVAALATFVARLECEACAPFVTAGTPVWDAEQELPLARTCPVAARVGIDAARHPRELNGASSPCTGAS